MPRHKNPGYVRMTLKHPAKCIDCRRKLGPWSTCWGAPPGPRWRQWRFICRQCGEGKRAWTWAIEPPRVIPAYARGEGPGF
jgi:hypothetical protein